MSQANGYAAQASDQPLTPFTFERRALGAKDVSIEILYCGVCHSDLHTARNEWHNTQYPSVPGHEIVGRVTAVGDQVGSFKVGDLAGVGCMVDSCRHCASCADGEEQYCENGFVGTYNGPMFGGENTYGGYSDHIVVDEKYVLHIRHDADKLAAVAPLLCAGITTYSPLNHWKVGPGKKVGIVGLGGLGHMGVKIAHAMGAHVVLFTTSAGKREDALRLGANEVVVSKNAEENGGAYQQLRFHPQHRGGAAQSGCVPDPAQARWHHDPGRRTGRTASVADGVQPDHEAAPAGRLADRRHPRDPGNAGFLRQARHRVRHRDDRDGADQRGLRALLKGDVKYRFVIDMASLAQTKQAA